MGKTFKHYTCHVILLCFPAVFKIYADYTDRNNMYTELISYHDIRVYYYRGVHSGTHNVDSPHRSVLSSCRTAGGVPTRCAMDGL